MSWKIEKYRDGQTTTIRMIGRMQMQHLQTVQTLIEESEPAIVLDLKELTMVDLETVRFLGRCQSDGVALLHGSQFIRDWIAKEQCHKDRT
jgi:hypothetical protein